MGPKEAAMTTDPTSTDPSPPRGDDAVRYERRGAVATVVLSRPAVRNAVDRDTAESLADAFRRFADDDEARAAVLWGEGGHFSAGADLTAIAAGRGNRVELGGDGPLGPTRLRLEKPTIAAIAGWAVAGGLELALWCDLRVVEESARLGVFCRRWGVPLVDGGTVRLPRLIGLSRALDLILTGREVGAREAVEIGLANRVVPHGEARRGAEELAATIARHPQACLRHDRASVLEGLDLPFARAMEAETRHGLAVLAAGEVEAGARRFLAARGRRAAAEGAGEDDAEPEGG